MSGYNVYNILLEVNNEVPFDSLYNFYTDSLGLPATLTYISSDNLYSKIKIYFKDSTWTNPAYGIISTMPVVHNHGNITSDGKIGTAADKVITTSTGGLLIANSTLPTSVTQSSLANLPTWTANPTDTTYLVRRDTGGSATYGQVTFLTVWNYISGKFTNTAAPTTKIYLDGYTGSGVFKYDSNVYLSTTAGELVADQFNVSEKAYMKYDTTEDAIKFVFA